LNLFGLVLNFIQIFCAKIKKEMEKYKKRKKHLTDAMGSRGPCLVPCGPIPRITRMYIIKTMGLVVYHKSMCTVVVVRWLLEEEVGGLNPSTCL
jgi:hypothetical protein